MKTKHIILSGLVALLASASSYALNIPVFDVANALDGDILIGARKTGSSDLVIDLGSSNLFHGLAGGVYTLDSVNVADFVSTFGSTWNSSSVKLSVFGGNGASGVDSGTGSNYALWLGSPYVGATAAVLNKNSAAGQTAPSNAIDGLNSYILGQPTLSNTATLNVPNTAGGYTDLVLNTQANSVLADKELTLNGTTKFDLYELQPGSGAGLNLGYFTFTDTGATFTVAAIPEPSVYAAILGAATLGFVALRRRQASLA